MKGFGYIVFRVFVISYNMITRHYTDMGPTVMRPLMSDVHNNVKVKGEISILIVLPFLEMATT